MVNRTKGTAHILRKLAPLIESCADATMALNKRGVVFAWNRAMENLTGVGKSKVVGGGKYAHGAPFFGKPKPMPVDAIVSPRIGKGYDDLKFPGGGFHGEIPAPALKGGGGRVVVWASPIHDSKGRIAGAIQYVRKVVDGGRKGQPESAMRDEIQDMLDSFSETFGVFDLEGRVVTLNKASAEFLNLSLSEVKGKDFSEYLEPEIAEKRKKMFAEVVRLRKPIGYETVFRDRIMRATFYPIPDRDGRIKKVGICAIDLTEEKKLEEELRTSQKRLKAYLEHASDVITVVDKNGRIVLQSPSFDEVIDPASVKQPLTIDWLIAQAHPEDVARLKEDFTKLYADPGGSHSTIYRVMDREGKWRVIEAFGRNLLDDPLVQGIVISARNITRRVEMDEKIKQAEAKYRGIFENAMDGIFECSPSGRFVSMNPAQARMLGYDSAEEAMREITDVGRQVFTGPAAYQKFIFLVDEKDFVRNLEVECLRKDGRKGWGLVNARALRDENGALLLVQGIVQDITDRKKLEAELLQSQKMEAIGRLAGGIAHDFNNMLTSLIGNSDLLLREIDASGASYQRARIIRDTAEKASQLTRQLVAISRKQIAKPEVLAPAEVIEGMLPMLERLLREDVKCSFEKDEDVPAVKFDRSQFEQILLNLAVNARDAMPRGGELKIALGKKVLGEEEFREHKDARPGEYVVISVSDTGTGIPDTIVSRIFEPFVTTKPAGTGLGLTIVKEAVTRWGGFIRIDTTVGKGTRFEVYVPKTVESAQEAEAFAVEEGAQAPAGKGTIMIVEDEQAVMEVMAEALESSGYSVERASSGEEAVAKIEQSGGKVDLVISDVVLPGKNGVETVKELKARFPALEAMLISGYLANVAAGDLGMDEGTVLLQKPFTMELLVRSVGQVLGV